MVKSKIMTCNPAKRIGLVGGLALALTVLGAGGDEPSWSLSNGHIEMQIESQGAIISDLRQVDDAENWLAAKEAEESAEPFAHFLCFDRWGPVTAAEEAAGQSFHGEAARIPWALLAPASSRTLELRTVLPRAGFVAERSIALSPDSGSFEIRTRVRNSMETRRPFNLVEHITLADQWNDPSVRLVTNGYQGLLHEKGQWVRDAEVAWPYVTEGGVRWDLRDPPPRRGRFIVSLRFPPEAEWAWVCLQDPRTGALLSYVWRTEQMPWLNLFWFSNGERIVRRAIEPGTSGLHRPMSELLQTPVVLNRPVVHWLAAEAQKDFAVRGGMALASNVFGLLKTIRLDEEGWVALDEGGQTQLLIPAKDIFQP